MPDGVAVRLRQGLRRHVELVSLCVLLAAGFAGYAKLDPSLLAPSSVTILSAQFLPLILAATGQTIVMLTAGVDLSVGAVVSLAMAIFAVTAGHVGVPAAAGLALGAAVAASAANGVLVAYAGLPPIIVTLAASFVWAGVTLAVLPQPGGSVPGGLVTAYNDGWHGIAVPAILGVIAVGGWKLAKTTWFGRALYAVGGNENGAYASGINTRTVKIGAYALAGLFVGLAGVALAIQTGSADPTIGTPYTLNSITAAVIGGVTFFGGVGTVKGAVLGALILGVLTNLMVFADVSSFYQLILQGAVLIAAISVKTVLTRQEAR